ncbi:HesB/YadR/YfhF family protein [Alkalicoccus urumqiensis]|uniref:Core domain-containing protein n=1 Tax=Alkalicoccus urumqiensis TaxID=1548213 RepID=A0A2P6MJ14_ALKUR|nr:HesB/YadR/YfhF family protein [Alkalicoccus urumqiensis]PRO66284.1 hypothetical protein C6I21_05640 [Alkalicoccus urumqiensis]
MKLTITEEAASWFKDQVELDEGDTIKFYAKYGGSSPIQSGFSLAFTPFETPDNPGVKTETSGITFFVEETDMWYFDGHDLTIRYNEDKEEIDYDYEDPEKDS